MVLRLALDSIARSSSEQRDRFPFAMRRHVDARDENARDDTDRERSRAFVRRPRVDLRTNATTDEWTT
jgi:hypothetical protein|tara:strand:- start:218 stop:421 length:204 start_codon:yes stop_codon:yes gene_type:complete